MVARIGVLLGGVLVVCVALAFLPTAPPGDEEKVWEAAREAYIGGPKQSIDGDACWPPMRATGLEWTGWTREEGEMAETVQVGDERIVGGVTCTVVEVIRETDADGGVHFVTESRVGLSLQKASGVPLASVSDSLFAAFVLKANDADTYAVGAYHPGFGQRIAPSPPETKTISETMEIGWAFPDITISHEGTPQAGVYVTLMARRVSIEDGTVVHLHGADRFVDVGSGVEGEWMTDGDGIVRQQLADGSALQPIYLPNGDGALFQRVGDLRDDEADAPTEYLSELRCYYRGVWVAVEEGVAATIDLAGASLTINGDAGAWAEAWLEDMHGQDPAIGYGPVQLVGGSATLTSLKAGRYTVVQRPTQGGAPWATISPREWVTIPDDGSNVEVTLDALAAPPSGKSWVYCYDYGAEPISATMYAAGIGDEVAPTERDTGTQLEGNTAESANVVVAAGTGFYVSFDGDFGDGCYELTCRGHVCFIDVVSPVLNFDALWWRGSDGHRDLYWGEPAPYILHEVDGRAPDIAFEEIQHGFRTVTPARMWPVPVWEWDDELFVYAWHWEADFDWDVVDQSGAVLLAGGNPDSVTADGLDDIGQGHDRQISSALKDRLLLGGKLSGNCVGGSDTPINADNLTEAARMGLEFGDWRPMMEVRILTDEAASGSSVGAVAACLGNVCSYCVGPVWRWPSAGIYSYGYCTQCASDARTYMRTPTVAQFGYDIRVVQYLVDGTRDEWELTKWLYPVNYREDNDDFLATWEGLQRWVAVHPTLGSWGSGAFSDGDDNSDIATACGLSETVYVQPKLDPATMIAQATYDIAATLADSSAVTFTKTLAAGATAVTRLTEASKIAAATGDLTPSQRKFCSDVTGVTSDDDGGDNSFVVIGDNPAYVDAQTPIVDTSQTPWCCQTGEPPLWDPMMDLALWGELWRAAESTGVVYVHRASIGREEILWEQTTRPWADTGDHYRPSVACHGDGSILVAATYGGNTVIARSRDMGKTWEEVSLPHIGAGLEQGTIYFRDGSVHICGWHSNDVLYRSSSTANLIAEQLSGATTTLTVVTAGSAEDVPRSSIIDGGGVIYVAVGEGGDMRTFRLRAMAEGFVEVT